MSKIYQRGKSIPLNLQFFAEPPAEPPADPAQGNNSASQNTEFDYEKLASIISGKQSVTEDTVLKNYFKQQGLSPEEMTTAINAFKEQKAKNTPDVAALQSQLAAANKAAMDAQIEKATTIEAMALGIDAKVIPYVLKMADMAAVTNEDGSIDGEKIKNAINKVLEDIPQLKPSTEQQGNGFRIGSPEQNNNNTTDAELKAAFGL